MNNQGNPTPERPPITIGWRQDALLGGHVSVSVFAGRNPGARGRAGTIVLREDEWAEIQARLGRIHQDIIPAIPDEIGARAHLSRWAAFTDEELDELENGISLKLEAQIIRERTLRQEAATEAGARGEAAP